MAAMRSAVTALVLASGLAFGQAATPGNQQPPEKPGEKKPAEQPKPAEKPAEKPAKPADSNDQKPVTPAKEQFVYYTMKTSMGEIVLELNGEKAPISVQNFVAYADSGHYEGTTFHRVIPEFMIQGGGMTANGTPKPTKDPIKNEWKNGLKNVRGSIAMARTSVIDSATCQFFINVKDNAALDMARDGAAYAVFGKVIKGMDVADKIVAVPRDRGDKPNTPILIEKMTKLSAEDAEKIKSAK